MKVVREAINQVQVGTDKTAAELAIVRYEKENVAFTFSGPRPPDVSH
jgi:hypothetical protein